MKIRIAPTQIQKQILAPSMQQSIEVLLLPVMELGTAIEQELQENPLLEIDEEKTSIEQSQLERLINLSISRIKEGNTSTPVYDSNQDDEAPSESRPIVNNTPLEDYLLEQLHLEITDPLELKIGEYIIGNLDEDGYFNFNCEEIAELFGLTDISIIEKVLNNIQNFEPLGVASRNIQECLLIQAHYKFNGKASLICQIIKDHFSELGRKKFNEIARKLKITPQAVKDAAKNIASLEPKPARKYRPVDTNIYIKPDITITKNSEDEYTVVINQDNIPQLRISKIYQNMLRQSNLGKEESDFIREKIKNGLLFIKSIEQRNTTMRGITQHLLTEQKEFFEKGSEGLKPMTLKDVANAIGRNESTICRAINNKYIDTPQGVYPMKFFFSQALSDNQNGVVSSRSIKEELKDLIEHENKTNPLSDQEIQLHFERKGMKVARRTVSKYRQALKILPSNLRKV